MKIAGNKKSYRGLTCNKCPLPDSNCRCCFFSSSIGNITITTAGNSKAGLNTLNQNDNQFNLEMSEVMHS